MNILKKSYPYYGKIYGILILCIFLGLMQGIVSIVEPQIITLIVDNVINPALGKNPEPNSSIFTFLIRDIPQNQLWKMMGILAGVFLLFMFLYFVSFYIRWNIAHYFSIKCDNAMRLDVMKKINSFGLPLLKDYSAGDLITIVNSDSEKNQKLSCSNNPVYGGFCILHNCSILYALKNQHRTYAGSACNSGGVWFYYQRIS